MHKNKKTSTYGHSGILTYIQESQADTREPVMLSKPMLTIHEVAALLKMRENTVRAWINEGRLRAVKFGRDWRVAQRDLEAYLEAHANRQLDPEEVSALEEKSDKF